MCCCLCFCCVLHFFFVAQTRAGRVYIAAGVVRNGRTNWTRLPSGCCFLGNVVWEVAAVNCGFRNFLFAFGLSQVPPPPPTRLFLGFAISLSALLCGSCISRSEGEIQARNASRIVGYFKDLCGCFRKLEARFEICLIFNYNTDALVPNGITKNIQTIRRRIFIPNRKAISR